MGPEGLVSYQRRAGSTTQQGQWYHWGPTIREGAPELILWAMVGEEWGREIVFEGAVAVEPETLVNLTKMLQEWINAEQNIWIFQHSTFQGEGENVAQAVWWGDVRMWCNGSYMPQLDSEVATAAWILECPHSGEQCKGVVQVPGESWDINAF